MDKLDLDRGWTPHHINLHTIQVECFNLVNIFYANKPIIDVRLTEAIEVSLEDESDIDLSPSSIIENYSNLYFNQISKSIFKIAMLCRYYDDYKIERIFRRYTS